MNGSENRDGAGDSDVEKTHFEIMGFGAFLTGMRISRFIKGLTKKTY